MDWFVKHWDELTRTSSMICWRAHRRLCGGAALSLPGGGRPGRRAWHVFVRDGGGGNQACLRILEPERGTAQIGRVLTVDRGTGLAGY